MSSIARFMQSQLFGESVGGLSFAAVGVLTVGTIGGGLLASWLAFIRSKFLEAFDEVDGALASDEQLSFVQQKTFYAFVPNAKTQQQQGIVLYPGALIHEHAYAILARKLARKGYVVVVLRSPLRLSPFAPKRADAAIECFAQVRSWAVGGHSLGAQTASGFITKGKHANKVKGLVLLGGYNSSKDLSGYARLYALTILAEHDKIIEVANVEKHNHLLPPTRKTETVRGGNHSGFGHYGPQMFPRPDGQRTISVEEQQEQVVNLLDAWLDLVWNG